MGDDDYTSYQKESMWEMIIDMHLCPNCQAKDSFLLGPRAGNSRNIKCMDCGRIFFISPFKGVGAWPINETKEVITV